MLHFVKYDLSKSHWNYEPLEKAVKTLHAQHIRFDVETGMMNTYLYISTTMVQEEAIVQNIRTAFATATA